MKISDKNSENRETKSQNGDDFIEKSVNKRIQGEPKRLNEDDQQRLNQQHLDANSASDTDPAEEMKRWSSAKRERNTR
jgi:hypothetical protein